MPRSTRGFSMVELMLALAIIGIISAIAIPSFLGSRQHARYVGDARTNAMILKMNLDGFKADNGLYPDPAGGPYTWLQGVPPVPNPLPSQTSFSGSTVLDFTVTIAANRLAFTITATDPRQSNQLILTMNQDGQIL